MNAARHFSAYQRPKIDIVDRSFNLFEHGTTATEPHCLILKRAFPPLVTYRTVQWMVNQEKLHGVLLCLFRDVRQSLYNHAIGYWGGTGRERLRRFFNFDETHSAVCSDREFLVIAESWNIDSRTIGHFDNG